MFPKSEKKRTNRRNERMKKNKKKGNKFENISGKVLVWLVSLTFCTHLSRVPILTCIWRNKHERHQDTYNDNIGSLHDELPDNTSRSTKGKQIVCKKENIK